MMRILVAEDDPAIKQTMCDVLEIDGFEPEGVGDGAMAMTEIRNAVGAGRPYGLLITDISMPVMNGLELVRWLLEEGFEISVLVVTGYGDKELLLTLRELGYIDFLDKPFEPEDLRLKVREVLAKAGAD